MTNLHEIKNAIEKLTEKFGGYDNVALLDSEPYLTNDPNRANGWDNHAIQIDGNFVYVGVCNWVFEHDLEDPCDQCWDFDTDEFSGFEAHECYEMAEADELEELAELLGI